MHIQMVKLNINKNIYTQVIHYGQ